MVDREACHHTPWLIRKNCSFWNWWSLQYLLSHIFCFFPLRLFFYLFLPPVHHTPTWNIFWHTHMNSCLIYILWLKVSLSPQLGPSEQILLYTPSCHPRWPYRALPVIVTWLWSLGVLKCYTSIKKQLSVWELTSVTSESTD